MRLTKINILSLGYVMAVISCLVGIVNAIYMFVITKNPSFATQLMPETQFSALAQYGGWFLIIVPIISIIFGFIGGVIFAAVYNWIVVKITGGLKIELEDSSRKK